MTIHEREAARKWTVPVLKTWGQGFTCIYTHIKIKGERRKSRRECWMEEEEGTQGSNHTIPLPPMPRSKDKVFGTGKVGSGLTNSLLPSGVLHFGQLAFFFVSWPSPSLCPDQSPNPSVHPPSWSQGCHRACFLMIAVILVRPTA